MISKELGDVYVARSGNGKAIGTAILHTYQRGEEASYASIKALFIDPSTVDQTRTFLSLLQRCEQTTADLGKVKLLTRMAANKLPLYSQLISHQYSLIGANVRMLKSGCYLENGAYNLTSWAG